MQEHRGPNEQGEYFNKGVALGHRRLSILDLSNGQQPMCDDMKKVYVIYNGEIYNFKDLRESLIKNGFQFKTNCDTEVIIYAWKKWGKSCVNQFRGMFAFAIYDIEKEEIFLARDRIGIKPLYYTVTEDKYLLFASELKSLLIHPGVNKQLNSKSIEEYFGFGYVPDPHSILKDVYKLPPGHTVLFKRRSNKKLPESILECEFFYR